PGKMSARGSTQSPCTLLGGGPSGLDRGTERRFIVIIRAAVEGCQGWARWLVFPRGTLRYTPTRHGGPPRDFTPPLAHAHRGALALRTQSGRSRHHALVLESCSRAGARLASPEDEGGRPQHLGRRGGPRVRAPRAPPPCSPVRTSTRCRTAARSTARWGCWPASSVCRPSTSRACACVCP